MSGADVRAVTGRVTRGGEPLEGAYVRFHGPSGEFVSERRTGPAGEFRLYLPPATWSVVAFAPGMERVTREFAVAPGQDLELTIELGGE